MPRITLPDGKLLEFPSPVSGRAIATAIGPGLAKHALGISVTAEGATTSSLLDLDRTIATDAKVRIVTAKDDDADALFLLRHSCAHILAEAICTLFPGTRLAYGPAV